MTEIRLTNTKSRRKEAFEPIDPGNVRLYVCGPTVYDRAHLGNGRPVVVFDVLFRLLRHVYGERHVTYVRNFTDVDDKINAAALARKDAGDPRSLEALIRERTDETIRWYHEDMDALGALRPTHEPRATEWIGAMIAMIEDLIAKGHAYEREGHVLFRVRSYRDYGALSGRSVDDMIAGARVEVAPFKEDPMDFVLWKPSDDELPGWVSPWGRGRPGWHIECSAMSYELLGATFDIHAGGIDLQFPHHENEIAQSCCAHPEGGFARVWMHNEMLLVDGRKMSKSLGNFFTVRDLLDQGWPGEVIRMVYLGTHYGRPMDWTAEKAEQAKTTLRNWAEMVEGAAPGEVRAEVVDPLSDDLNTAGALAALSDLYKRKDAAGLLGSAHLLGVDLKAIRHQPWARPYAFEELDGRFLREGIDYQPTVGVIGWGEITDQARETSIGLLHRWLALRRAGDFETADRLKTDAMRLGVELRAQKSPNGVTGGLAKLADRVDVSALEGLL
ncbi:cysteine--tRNA ligase [Cereibacter sphaeroides]|uniref:cysteine--tRNA ligase n=1 Tax=Cereibacter sphaeroides TaxID=1063 RepID=UPI000F51EE2B|nr:cysteine--tRNA ligase [Cereibacter sphaeroides]AZB63929.1 cysteine--tRNA ligase [Cereibacter sphaeroides]AZB68148.1 cysteine--tRNA ligase [Cereibacter sphaeroides]